MQKVDLKQLQIKSYLFSKKQVICNLNIKFIDSINSSALEIAVNKALECNEYFRTVYFFKEDMLYSDVNHNDYKINNAGNCRNIPDETDGFLFDILVNDKVFILSFDHMLADGKGIRLFAASIVNFYCEARYGTSEEKSEKVIQNVKKDNVLMDSMNYMNKLREQGLISYNVDGGKNRSVYPHGKRYAIRMNKKDWNDTAGRYHVRPFVLISAIICEAFRHTYGGDECNFGFPIDLRSIKEDKSECNYYCMLTVDVHVEYREKIKFEEMLCTIEKLINLSLTTDSIKNREGKNFAWIDEILSLPKKLDIKRRMIQIGMAQPVEREFWVSCSGNLLQMIDRRWRNYISDYQMWAPPIDTLFVVETGTIYNQRELWIESRENIDTFVESMSHMIGNLGIEIQTERL